MVFYPDTWQCFTQLQHTQCAEKREYPEWHKGRMRYYLWAIDVDMPVLYQRLQYYKTQLSDYLVMPYVRQPHITIAVSGFLTAAIRFNDDVSVDDIDQQMLALQTLALPRFLLQIGGANSFASAPFLEVEDKSQSLEKIRAALVVGQGDFRTTHYVPHVTIGIYNGAYPVTLLQAMLQGQAVEPVAFTVNSIGLYSYDATDIGSPLRRERLVELI